MAVAIIVHGPKGCGKTTNADAIAKHFKCTCIVDDNNATTRMLSQTPWPAQRTLFLINTGPSALVERLSRNAETAGRKDDRYEVYTFDEVMQKMAVDLSGPDYSTPPAQPKKREIIVVYGPCRTQQMMSAQATAIMTFYEANVVYNCHDHLTSYVGHAIQILKEISEGAHRVVALTTQPRNLELSLSLQRTDAFNDVEVKPVFLGEVMAGMAHDLSALEDRILGNMSSEQLAAMESNEPMNFYNAGVITAEKAEAIVKQFRDNHPEIDRLWPTPRKAVLPRTTGYKMPVRHKADVQRPVFATAFTGEDEQSKLRIEDGYFTEVAMPVNKPFTLRLVALLISHFDITPADIANETRLCGFDKEPGEA